jgi:hypothetical protein
VCQYSSCVSIHPCVSIHLSPVFTSLTHVYFHVFIMNILSLDRGHIISRHLQNVTGCEESTSGNFKSIEILISSVNDTIYLPHNRGKNTSCNRTRVVIQKSFPHAIGTGSSGHLAYTCVVVLKVTQKSRKLYVLSAYPKSGIS